MITSYPEDKEVLFAYLTMHDFFDTYILADARQYLQSILKAAIGKSTWQRAAPFSMLHYMDNLGKLGSAAFTIHRLHAQRPAAILGKPPANGDVLLSVLQQCVGSKVGDSLWSCFPRSLSLQQYYDPYKAIKKYCTYMPPHRWTEALADLQEYALSRATINDVYPGYNMLSIRRRLLQLIEACHLLEVRTNNSGKTPASKKRK